MASTVDNLSETMSKLWSTYVSDSSSDSPVILTAANSAVLASVIFAAFVISRSTGSNNNVKVPYKRGIPFIGSWDFFTQRFHFVEEGLKTLGGVFRFNILQHKVLVVSGEDARKEFFGNKHLDMAEGYRVLLGGVPDLDTINEVREHGLGDMAWFGKRIVNVLKKERLARVIPLLIADVDRAMANWGSTGQFDTFDKIYNIVFQLSIRAASCHEIADSPDTVARVTQLYWDIEHGSTATTVLLPWIPSKARNLRDSSTRELYEIVKTIVDDRKQTGKRGEDAMQVLLDEGDGLNDIVQFILATLFAGIINTGIMSSWILLYLHVTPEWKKRAIDEVKSFIAQYADKADAEDLPSLLSAIPPEVWDESMPVLDLCLRETIRTVLSVISLRRVLNDDGVKINGVKVDKGGFVAYSFAETHFNENIYNDPERWDPGRYEKGEDKKEQYAFLGWGVGRHPCLGMRFAKLEVKIILALFLTRYEYTLVDTQGRTVEKLPEPHRDNLYQVPPISPVYLKYNRVGK